MTKNEAQTDIWVYNLLKSAHIALEYQGSTIAEIDKALKTASKADTGKSGKPEFIGVVKNFVIVIENKADTALHECRDKQNNLLEDTSSKQDCALYGVLHYAKHLLGHTKCKGDEKPIGIRDYQLSTVTSVALGIHSPGMRVRGV